MIRIPTKKSREVLEFETIARDARAMSKLLQTYVSPKGKSSEGHIAIHHSQYSADPYNFFVINPRVVGAQSHEIVVVVNPKILEKKKDTRILSREACMSFPFRHGVKVWRYDAIKVGFHTPAEDGKTMRYEEKEFTGLMAHIFQHEYEHSIGTHIYAGTSSH